MVHRPIDNGDLDRLKQELVGLQQELDSSKTRENDLTEQLSSAKIDFEASNSTAQTFRVQCETAEERTRELEASLSEAQSAVKNLEAALETEKSQVEARAQQVKQDTFTEAKAVFDKVRSANSARTLVSLLVLGDGSQGERAQEGQTSLRSTLAKATTCTRQAKSLAGRQKSR
jgi:chromosome segregation ATPase